MIHRAWCVSKSAVLKSGGPPSDKCGGEDSSKNIYPPLFILEPRSLAAILYIQYNTRVDKNEEQKVTFRILERLDLLKRLLFERLQCCRTDVLTDRNAENQQNCVYDFHLAESVMSDVVLTSQKLITYSIPSLLTSTQSCCTKPSPQVGVMPSNNFTVLFEQ